MLIILENTNDSRLLFPVILITGISDPNEIKDLAFLAASGQHQALHLVVMTLELP